MIEWICDKANHLCQVTITEEENGIVATDINSGVASQGKTIEEATNNLKEALNLYYSSTDTA